MDGEEQLRHPRAIAAFRVVLWVVVVAALFVVAVASLGFLGTLAVVGGVLAAFGQSGLLAVGSVALVGVTVVGAATAGLVVGARRLERRAVAADRRPDPVEAVKDRYVRDHIDEVELEERLERVLEGAVDERPTAGRSAPLGRAVRRVRSRDRER